jgi:SAM-dependent methyltransferase
MTSQAPQPTPMLFFDTLNSYQRSEALKAAIQLDLFTAVGTTNGTSTEIATRCSAAERGVRILCDYLTMIGFLSKEGDRYRLTQDSAAFLDRRSPAYLGSVADFLLADYITGGFKSLADAVRRGGTVVSAEGSLEPDHPMWVTFARAMAPMMHPVAQMMAQLIDPAANRKLKVLDIASSHGLFGLAFATRNPNAEVYAVDWANVLELGKENANKMAVGDRYHTIPGSAFEVEFGAGYDVVLLTNFLHHFDIPTNESLLKRVHASLADDGVAATLEFVPNSDRVSPEGVAGFSLIMLATTPSGDAYTLEQFDRMFKNAGFVKNEIHSLEPAIQQLIVSRK